MDLTTTAPASVRETLLGVVMLPRTADKAKAAAHGEIGEYHYDCPMDKGVFGFLGIDAPAFLEAVKSASSDADLEAFVKPYVEKKSPIEIATFNESFLARGPEAGSESAAYFTKLRDSIDPSRTDIVSWADLLDLDEKRPVPRRDAA